jgi:hypothetical protein
MGYTAFFAQEARAPGVQQSLAIAAHKIAKKTSTSQSRTLRSSGKQLDGTCECQWYGVGW